MLRNLCSSLLLINFGLVLAFGCVSHQMLEYQIACCRADVFGTNKHNLFAQFDWLVWIQIRDENTYQ